MSALTTGRSNELLELFTRYNEDWWPVHVLTYTLGLAAVVLLFAHRRHRADAAITVLLATLWLWLAVVFQGAYATDVDLTLGAVYAALFALQAWLFLRAAWRRDLRFGVRNRAAGVVGWVAIGYAVAIYPILGMALGHGWPESPLLGMAPCPTTILTFGLLLLAQPPVPRHLLVVPLVWALLAPPAAMGRGVYEDLGLFIAGIAGTAIILIRDHRRAHAAEQPSTLDDGDQRASAAVGPRR